MLASAGNLKVFALFAWVALAVPASSSAQEVFFLAIGSEHYASSTLDGVRDFSRIRGANRSAERVAGLLTSGGARFGVQLTSAPGSFVSRSDIDDALEHVIGAAESSQVSEKIVVVYFAGHGLSEGVGWNHFSMPGNVVLSQDTLDALDLETLSEGTVHAGMLAERLDATGLSYVLVIDTCYEGQEAEFASPVLSPEAIRNLEDAAAILRFVNEFHQASPVLFSTEPGTLVSTVRDPQDPASRFSIAPLARRITLLASEARRDGRHVNIGDLVTGLTNSSLDQATRPAVTHAQRDLNVWGLRLLAFPPTSVGEIERRLGTAVTDLICCDPGSQSGDASEEDVAAVVVRLQITGHPDDFVSDGADTVIEEGEAEVTVFSFESNAVSLLLDTGDDFWSVDLSLPPDTRFETKRYQVSGGLGQENRPNLDIGGNSRGCNETRGYFDVLASEYDPQGRLERLVVDFRQFCDESSGPLSGQMAMRQSR